MVDGFDVYGLVRLILSGINLLFVIFVLFFERKNSTSRFAWLMVLLFLPVIGMILYILFSGNFFTASKRMRKVNYFSKYLSEDIRNRQRDYLVKNINTIPHHTIKKYIPLVKMNLEHGNSILTTAYDIKIFTHGIYFFEDLCTALENAKESIYMEYFIFHNDKIGNRIMEILCRKAEEGLDVKLIYDDLGSISTPTKFFKRLNKAGGDARPFFQIRIGLAFTLNYRNHRKLTVIDNNLSYIGGINIGDEYANQKEKGRHHKLNWRDTVVRMSGNAVLTSKMNFLLDWFSLDVGKHKAKTIQDVMGFFPEDTIETAVSAIETNNEERLFTSFFDPNQILVQIVNSGPTETTHEKIEDALITMINSAKKTIYIQTPYFTPTEQFLNALKLASFRGVKVNIMIPSQWDKFYMKAASYQFASEMSQHEINFYLYNGFIHAKTIVVDGKICSIGTTNIDNRSFSLHYEQNAIFYDRRISTKCIAIFNEDIKSSKYADSTYFKNKKLIVRATWSLFKLFSPFM